MNERIRWFEAQATSSEEVYFPFTQAGLCSQLSPELIPPLKTFEKTIGDFTLRIAQSIDASYLEPLLRSYGEASENYGDLEFFNEEKLPVVITNISNCLQHRYFITFLLFDDTIPIAFFQIDPYDMPRVQALCSENLLPFWEKFFREPLRPAELLSLPYDERLEFLRTRLQRDALEDYCRTYGIHSSVDNFLRFLVGSLQTVQFLQQTVPEGFYIGNISYNLLQQYRRKGLMAQILRAAESVARQANIVFLFSDRIADGNKPSIHLLQHDGFKLCGSFIATYGEVYKTRRHPNGNFSEPCVCYYKMLSSENISTHTSAR
ncbi:MAG: GNAT family N-acetyltransferase [Opitutales bacterium]|nr:GNAT family N-acetyltransferase [Opitutales bacterium]